MQLNPEFLTYEADGEQILVAAGTAFSGIVRSNPTAAFIVNCLKTETTEAEITARLLEKYDVPEATAAADVHRIVEILRSIDAIHG